MTKTGISSLLKARPLWPLATVIVAAALGIALSVAAWFAVSAREKQLSKQEFSALAADQAQSLQAGLDRYLQMIKALRSLFDASKGEVTRAGFQAFIKDFLHDQNAILAFSWVPRVRQPDRARHELAGRSEGIDNYHIKAVRADGSLGVALNKEEYFPIFYSNEPPTGRGYGIDLQDGGIRQGAIDRALDGNNFATSANFRLQSGEGDRTGFFVLLPVFRTHSSHATVQDRKNNLIGFVQGVFQFHVMIDAILAPTKSPLSILLYDKGEAAANDLPAYVHAVPNELARLKSRPLSHASEVSWTGFLNVGDRSWEMVVLPSPEGEAYSRHDRAWIVLFAGLFIAGLSTAYLASSINHIRRLQSANETASELANSDSLTNVANRRAFVDRLTAAFDKSSHGGNAFAVYFIDLDDFKDINDCHGHATGDALLKQVASRLAAVVRTNDLVARFGGDEFAILQEHVADPEDASTFAQRLIVLLSAPYAIDDTDLRITASVGISLYAAQEEGPKEMMMQADLALYRAKNDGRGGFSFYSGVLSQEALLRITLADELKNAIGRGELECHYQPQVEIGSGRIVGMEVLLRWNHPKRGLIMPGIFIPVAERSEIIQQLGKWVIESAFAQMARWETMGIAPQILAINISGMQLRRSDDFVRDITSALLKWRIRSDTIEFELTEIVLMEASQKHRETFDRLRDLGLRIAIDDFGTGYSSLKYLTVYPVNRLKIAQELVIGVTSDQRNATVVKAAIRLASELGIQVIAEGVETEAQARFLESEGCGFAQGYFYSRPVDVAAATRMLRRVVLSQRLTPDKSFQWKQVTANADVA